MSGAARFWPPGAITGYSSFAFATADARRQVIVSSSLFSPRDGKQVLAMVNAVNLEFCGEPWRPPAGRTSVQDVGLMLET